LVVSVGMGAPARSGDRR